MAEEKEEDDFSDKDETDDQIDDVEADGEDDAEGDFGADTDAEGEGDVEDRVQDLEDALEDLKAEFEQLMAGEEGEEHMGADDMGDEFGGEEPADDMGGDEFGMDEPEMAEAPGMQDAQTIEVRHSFAEDDEQLIREYVEKVNGGFGAKIGGDNGVQTKSVVAGKNDMGGTVSNIAQGGSEASVEANKGNLKGSSLINQNPQDMKTGNINVPGGNAGKTGFKKKEPGHGAEKKGTAETSDKSATSTLNGVKTRAK
jgi:hypothetical protein